jgi:hypothetical protein
VDVALEGTDDLLLEHSRSGIAEDTDAELEAVIAPALSVNENFHVTCFAISGNNRSNGENRGRFARGFRSDLRHRTYRKTIFNHDEDVICDPPSRDHGHRKNLRGRYTPRLEHEPTSATTLPPRSRCETT